MENNRSTSKKSKLSEILESYSEADNYCVINEDDPQLHPIFIKMPACPPIEKIDGYGLHAKDQRFVRQKTPQKIIDLQNNFDTIDEIWNELEENAQDYQEEIRWIKLQWYRRFHGYWCFINGKPTFFDGWNYCYLNFWKFLDGGYPEFRDRNRKFFHGMRYAYTTTEVPEYEEEIILIYRDINVNGQVEKVPATHETGSRVFFGIAYPKNRRDGATNMCLCAQYLETITKAGVISGIISMNGQSAKDHYSEILVPGWQGMPFFLKPIHDGFDNPEDAIKFFAPKKKGQLVKLQKQLRSKITYSQTAQSTGYDRSKIFWMLLDESGKCFGRDTPILMYDGSVKMVQDVMDGDLVMGDDSTPRNVFGITSGTEEMFEIKPNKGASWMCNRSHILAIVVTSPMSFNDRWHKTGDLINMTVSEYLTIKASHRKCVALYRSGWEMNKKKHTLSPYFIGVWLGDGRSLDSSVTTTDQEVLNELIDICYKFGMYLRTKQDGISYHISCGKINGKNPVLKELQRLNLISNKHIPESYLKDSRENRLQLLAGLVDTDGHLEKSKTTKGAHLGIEITQKNAKLAANIQELATSLGFYCSNNKKTASMKRGDGSMYYCEVNRLHIYGDIDIIPTKIKHKKAVVSRTKNRRNPQKTGFNIHSIGEGKFYGFAVDKNHMFLLADGTVVHNTIETNVDSRHQILRNCVSQGGGSTIGGFMTYPSTVGEMRGKGGLNYFNLCKKSHWENRSKIGQTTSGLMNIFFKSQEGLEGFVDPFGNSVVDTPTPMQIWAAKREKKWEDTYKYALLGMGSKQYLQERRKAFLDAGDMDGYNEELRLFPQNWAEAFRTEDGDVGFNTVKLNERIDKLKFTFKKEVRRGNFEWENNVKDSKVIWVDNEKGRWYLSKYMRDDETNLRYMDNEAWFPINPRFTSSADTYEYDKKSSTRKASNDVNKSKRMSDGGGSVFWDFDPQIDNGRDIAFWESHRLVCTYRFRPPDLDDYCEDMLMMSVYFGAMMYPETNKRYVWKHFDDRGYGGYMKYDIDVKTNNFKDTPGYTSLEKSKQDLFNAVRDYIEKHAHRCMHLDFLNECKEISGVDDMTNYDLFTAGAGAIMGSKSKHAKIISINSTPVNISQYAKKRVYKL